MAKGNVEIKRPIQEAIGFLNGHYKINEAILFGSQLSGKNDRWSDIDLAVISPDFNGKSYEEIINTFAELAVKFSSKVELHPYTPNDVKEARPTNFLGYILKNGKVVYKNGKLLI
jgi:predicted nucleotidyltransferase